MPTGFETAVLAESPILNWDGQVGGTNAAVSTGSTTLSMSAVDTIGTPGTGPLGAGDATLNFNSEGYWNSNTLPTSLDAQTTGVMLVSFKLTTLGGPVRQYLFSVGEKANGAKIIWFTITTTGSISLRFSEGTGVMDAAPTTPVSLADSMWHFLVIRQKADGTGFEMYLDGAWLAVTQSAGGTTSINDWFSSFNTAVPGADAFRLGRSAATSSENICTGEMSHFTIFGSALSNAQIATLYAAWLGAPDFSNKTIRRKNRRIYFDI